MIKIAYVVPTLEVGGGIERMITEKANYLANHFGYDIHIICLCQHGKDSNFFSVSEKIKQTNLGISYYSHYKFKYPKRLWKKFLDNYILRRELTKTVHHINPDILISVSFAKAKADLICSLSCRAIKIIESHEPRHIVQSTFNNGSIASKIYEEYLYYSFIEKKADLIVTLTKESLKDWNKAKRIEVIPNFSNMSVTKLSDCKEKRVIAVGRLDREKGFDRLLDIWKLVVDKHPDWQLDIFGDGDMKETLKQKIKAENILHVSLCGPNNTISQEYAKSSICVVTSYYEGFSLVLLEAMKHGVPCVAFDCPYGPRSIIENGKSGYLVEDGNQLQFAEKLYSLIENEQLRFQVSKASIKRAQLFDKDTIMLKWKDLFEDLIKERS